MENSFLLKARLKAAEPTEPQGSAQRWRSGYAKRNVCGASYGSGEQKKKSKIIPKKSYKILDKRKILWYNKADSGGVGG